MASGDCNPGPAATPSLPCVAEREAAGWAANKRKNQSTPIARCQARNSGPLNKSASFASSAGRRLAPASFCYACHTILTEQDSEMK